LQTSRAARRFDEEYEFETVANRTVEMYRRVVAEHSAES
jgi:hypothetical protein